MAWKQLSGEFVVSLFPVYQLSEAMTGPIAELTGRGLQYFATCFTGQALTYCVVESDWNAAHQAFAAKLEADPGLIDRIIEAISERGDNLCAYSENVGRMPLAQKSNPELYQLFEGFVELNRGVYAAGGTMPLLEYQDTTWVSDKLKKIIEAGRNGQDGPAVGECLSVLSTPRQPTSEKQAQTALLELAASLLESDAGAVKFIAAHNAREIADSLQEASPQAAQALVEHCRQWRWTQYVYEGPALDKEFFAEELKLALQGDPRKTLARNHEEEVALAARQRELEASLNVGDEGRRVIDAARKITYWKPMRRLLQTRSYYLIEPLQKEIAARLGLPLGQVRWLLPGEIKAGLDSGVVDSQEISRRMARPKVVLPDPDSPTTPSVSPWRTLIVTDPGVLAGKPVVRGTRLSVDFVLGLFASGWTEQGV